MNKNKTAKLLANITFHLLARYEEHNTRLANERGLTESEFKCFRLFGSDKGLSNQKIAARMNLSESRLTRIIDGLVAKGYMMRRFDQKDSRRLNITLSRKGKSLAHKLDKLNDDVHIKILNDIKISEHKALIGVMENLYSATEKWLKKGN
jgi:DNA-binding MarR family transcriptional regulator